MKNESNNDRLRIRETRFLSDQPLDAGRWQELLLPVSKDKHVRQHISERVQGAFKLKWKAVEEIVQLQRTRS